MLKKILFIVSILAGLNLVALPNAIAKENSIILEKQTGAIEVIKDKDYNVTCWIYTGYYRGGIFCIPDSQLTPTPSKKEKQEERKNSIILEKQTGAIEVIKDKDYNVTCWIYTGYYRGGIFCIPDSQLTPSKKKKK